jgi:quercetin dioxygenase-like cupin family protein
MALTFIDTNQLPKTKTPQGEVTAVMNRALFGAENVEGSLRWLKAGERFLAASPDKHQLIYLMEGQGKINLDNNSYEVSKGAGVYLGPSESATIQAADRGSLKLFHLVVARIPA